MKINKNMKNPIALKSILALALGVFLAQSSALAGPGVIGEYAIDISINGGNTDRLRLLVTVDE